ncbi:urease accessory protein UreF [Marimonas sp. MJW-29]|uniref:Urease accessory protein UreF n=1 Tax=Sulfitobacter sediminis TaxID=3234186 RepID=A0ABV3RJR3_9RHOB
MVIERHVLTLAQWLSPAFPVGAFAYSHGLESAIASGQIATAAHLQDWLESVLLHGSGRTDCILLRAAHAAVDPTALAHIDATARAFAASSERLVETDLQGDAFCKTVSDVWGTDMQGYTYPVAVGAAAARTEIHADLTASMYLQAFASNLVSAAVRAVPLGQTEGQAVLAALTPTCERIASETAHTTLDDLSSTAFLSDIAAMQHETLQPRIFRT